MRILFTVPTSRERFNGIPDLGQGYLASYARAAGHKVGFLDCLAEGCDLDEFDRRALSFRPDVLGLKVFSCDAEIARDMVARVRARLPNTITVIGGPHPSCELPERLMAQFPSLDYAFAGEAEPGFVSFLESVSSNLSDFGHIPGLIWRDGDRNVRANPKASVEDLDEIPFPAWDLLDPSRYRSGYSFMTRKLPAAPMSMTRGCPYHCTFCSSHLISGRKVRQRSVGNIIEEIKLLRRNHGVRTIDIVDENFAFDRQLVVEFCEHLLREDLGVEWNCPYGVRLTSLDEEVVRLMARSGCFGLSVGVESASQRVLDTIRKSLEVEQIVEKVRMIRRVSKIMIQGYFMMGFPGETVEEIDQTIDLACSLPFDIVVFCPLRVTRGTDIYDDLREAGRLPWDLDYQGFGHHGFVRSYCDVPDSEMRRLYRKAYRRFYFRPKVMLNLLRRLRSVSHAKTIYHGLARMVVSSAVGEPQHIPSTREAGA